MEYLLQFQEDYRKYVAPEVMLSLETDGRTFTGVNESGEVIVCGGVRELWEGRGELWALFNPNKQSYCKSFHKCILQTIEEVKIKRLEMAVYCENKLGHKLAKLLGFKLEAERLRAYRPDGGDISMYVMINGEK